MGGPQYPLGSSFFEPSSPVTGAGRGLSGNACDQEVRTCSVSICLGLPSGDRHCLPSFPQPCSRPHGPGDVWDPSREDGLLYGPSLQRRDVSAYTFCGNHLYKPSLPPLFFGILPYSLLTYGLEVRLGNVRPQWQLVNEVYCRLCLSHVHTGFPSSLRVNFCKTNSSFCLYI